MLLPLLSSPSLLFSSCSSSIPPVPWSPSPLLPSPNLFSLSHLSSHLPLSILFLSLSSDCSFISSLLLSPPSHLLLIIQFDLSVLSSRSLCVSFFFLSPGRVHGLQDTIDRPCFLFFRQTASDSCAHHPVRLRAVGPGTKTQAVKHLFLFSLFIALFSDLCLFLLVSSGCHCVVPPPWLSLCQFVSLSL